VNAGFLEAAALALKPGPFDEADLWKPGKPKPRSLLARLGELLIRALHDELAADSSTAKFCRETRPAHAAARPGDGRRETGAGQAG